MIRRTLFLVIGVVLILITLPVGIPMLIEFVHSVKMNATYEISNINEEETSTDSVYHFNQHVITIDEQLGKETYESAWQNNMGLGDIVISLDSQEIDWLENHPIRIDEQGLNRYYGEVSYLVVDDKKKNDTYFVILVKDTREIITANQNGDMTGSVPEDELTYTMHTLDRQGNYSSETFRFNDRNALQTELLNHSGVSPYAIGYHTDLLETYPTLIFPLIYPFFTFISGLCLVIFFLPRLKKTGNQPRLINRKI